jgi:hypothetical protein
MITTRAAKTYEPRAHDARAVFVIFLLLAVGPRLIPIVSWLAAPGRWEEAFNSVAVPVIGSLCLPWTTLMYVIVAPSGQVEWADCWWLAAAVAADILPLVCSAITRAGTGYAR